MSPDTAHPIDLMFGGMEKLAPGSNEHTLGVLRSLPRTDFTVIVDAGCGSGRQTLVLARELNTPVDALDTYEPFLTDLARRARDAGLGHLVRTHCMDMKDIPALFPHIDLLWSEGAAYSIGFQNALTVWAPTLRPDSFLVASELCWMRDQVPADVRDFFAREYPAMRSLEQNAASAEAAGYRVLRTLTLPPETWVDGYYDVLEPRAHALVKHGDEAVRGFAGEMLEEIDAFRCSGGSYGYVFYVLQRM
jgi:SAM-dependent methyltransferase